MKSFKGLGFVVALGFAPVPVLADDAVESCAARSAIVDLATRIIDGREGLSRLKSRGFGVDAAYLSIRYGDMSESETTALFDRLIAEKLWRIDEMRLTYEIANGSAGADDINDREGLASAYQSPWRAVILSDDGSRFLDWAQTATEPSVSGLFRREDWIAFFTARLLADASDAERARVAATAVQKREVVTALALLSEQEDLTAFFDLAARYPKHRVLREVRSFPESYGVSLRAHTAPIDLGKDEGRLRNEFRWRFFELRRVDYRFGPFSFLQNFTNIAGEEYFITDAAKGVNEAMDAGWLDPVKRPEQAWISLYRRLTERMGQEAVDAGLGRIGRNHAFDPERRTVRDTIHDAIAKAALRDYAAGQVNNPPQQPSMLQPQTGFDWPVWVRVAQAVRKGRETTLTDNGEILIASEILFSIGQFDRAIDLVEKASSQDSPLTTYKKMMTRLDWTCGAFTWSLGDGFGPAFSTYYFEFSG